MQLRSQRAKFAGPKCQVLNILLCHLYPPASPDCVFHVVPLILETVAYKNLTSLSGFLVLCYIDCYIQFRCIGARATSQSCSCVVLSFLGRDNLRRMRGDISTQLNEGLQLLFYQAKGKDSQVINFVKNVKVGDIGQWQSKCFACIRPQVHALASTEKN